MRTYPKNTEELEKKHNFSFPLDNKKLELIHSNIILRNDIAYLFFKSRILNSLQTQNLFKNELSSESFLNKKFNQTDRLKIYKAIKKQLPLEVGDRKKLSLYSLFNLNEKPKIDTRISTINDLIFDLIKKNRLIIKREFETFFKHELDNLKY
ncbi:hypothetical protein [uncultured Tenacibaculum sp.]|uniref:hypothetical protein n=1 Tax=uncultured Tenacibaculum sp. TaxID=174713 RepID=UPI00261B3ADE|nr:hypothetical protein [uncultured Tenacibaculum sp.]